MRSLVQVQDGPFGVGGLAQLVERLLCKQDVRSSSLLTSTGRTQSPFFETGDDSSDDLCDLDVSAG